MGGTNGKDPIFFTAAVTKNGVRKKFPANVFNKSFSREKLL